MLQSISWHQYWFVIISLTVLYYLAVYFLYFRGRLQLLIQSVIMNKHPYKTSQIKGDELIATSMGHHESEPNCYTDDHETHVHACIDELAAFFENGKGSKAMKSEIMRGLHIILQKYPSIKNSAYRQTLSNLIATQCQNICSIHLSAEEMKGVWFG